jgi:hypothetical protein
MLEPDLLAYAAFWNSGRFFEAHETLEARWMRERDPGLQGLIQLAAALHHLARGNVRGARTMLDRCLARFENDRVAPCRVDLTEMSAYARRLRSDAGASDASQLIDERPRIGLRDAT